MLTKNEIKYIRLLQDKKHREEVQRFVAEGNKWVEELMKWQPGWLETLYATEDWVILHGKNIPEEKLKVIPEYDLEKISGLCHPAPVVAVCRKPLYPVQHFIKDKWNLALDGIQDPGNLGSILRLADWFGLDAVWCSPDCADAFNPKVVQATMGSLCRVKVFYGDLGDLLSQAIIPVFVSGMDGRNVFETKTHEGILVIGSEGKGVRPDIFQKATHTLTIPRIGHAESLNAAMAAGIMVAHLTNFTQKSRGH